MKELLTWLARQKGGIGTYFEFQNRALALRAQEPDNAALLRLIADIAGRFADDYDRQPLPVDIAGQALARLSGMLQEAIAANGAPAAERLELLNRISEIELA